MIIYQQLMRWSTKGVFGVTTKELKGLFGMTKDDYVDPKTGRFNRTRFEQRTIDLAVQDINEKSKCIRNLRYEKKKKGSRVQGYVFYYDYVDPNEFRPNYTKAIESDRTVNNAEQMELKEFLKEFE